MTGYVKQQGFLLPTALFLILFASGAALLMSKQVTQSANHSLVSGFSKQSLYAAETAAQLGAHQLRFLAHDRRQTDQQCQALMIDRVFDAPSLNQCRLIVRCQCRYENGTPCDTSQVNNYDDSAGIMDSFYRIESRAVCGVGFAASEKNAQLELRYRE